ncbi:MAG: BTAD domain-containing putative transcriptional regulator [Gemmatimonadota bacterium]|jgi:DNA-binding SARP family transcriptional activator/TolB-like protein
MASRISVLGTSDLRREDGTQVQSVLHQPRRFALLVYLALASRQGPVRRDTVMGVFWADKPQDKARGALNQAVHYVRRSLGQDAIVTTGDTIELDRTLVSCDAAEFLDAVDGERWRIAADLYAGDLMPGFFDSADAVDFEHWLDAERRRLERAASEAAWRLAKEAEAAGETADAVVWARRVCEWSTNDEAEVRRVMVFMAELGDRTGVVDAYESLKAALHPLAVEPAPETTDLVRSLRKKWEEEDTAVATDQPAAPTQPQPMPKARGNTRRWPVPVAGAWRQLQRLRSGAVTLVLTLALISLWGLRRDARTAGDPAPDNPHPTVLVESLQAEANGPVAAGALGDQIVTQLQSMTGFNVVDGTNGKPSRAPSANFVLRGGLIRTGDHLQANVHLIDGTNGSTVASEQFDRTQPDSLATLDELSAAIASFTRRSIGTIEEERRIANADAPPAAITLVQLGRGDLRLADSLRDTDVYTAAAASYEKADSTFVEAAAQAKNWSQPWIERARAAQGQMWLRLLDPSASARESALDMALQGANYASKAVEKSKDSAEALEIRARLEHWAWQLSDGMTSAQRTALLDRAENDARKVTALAPRRATAWNLLGGIAIQRGEWGDAYWALTRAIGADAYLKSNAEITLRLFTAAWETNNIDAARSWCDLIEQQMGRTWPTAYCRLHLDAVQSRPDTNQVDSLRMDLKTAADWTRIRPSFDALAAVIFARNGDRSRAEALLKGIPSSTPLADDATKFEAWAWLELRDDETARALLGRYVEASPSARSGILRSRRFSTLAMSTPN